jgi:hypothetical protein
MYFVSPQFQFCSAASTFGFTGSNAFHKQLGWQWFKYYKVKDWISVFSKRIDLVEDVNALSMGMLQETFILTLIFI